MPLSTMKSLIASAAPSYTSCSTTVTGKNHVMDAATALAQLCQWGNGGAVDDSPSLSTMTLSPPPTTTTAEGKTLAPFEEENPLENEKYEKQEDDTFIINQNCSSSHKTTTAKHCNSGNNNTNEKWIFPQRLMTILNDTNRLETIHVISWLPHGKSFMILKPEKLMRDVLPLFFPPRASSSFALDEAKGDRSTNSKTALTASLPKYVSFTRKLHRWGFRQEMYGPDAGAYSHELFIRDQPELCLKMICDRTGASLKKKIKGISQKEVAVSTLSSTTNHATMLCRSPSRGSRSSPPPPPSTNRRVGGVHETKTNVLLPMSKPPTLTKELLDSFNRTADFTRLATAATTTKLASYRLLFQQRQQQNPVMEVVSDSDDARSYDSPGCRKQPTLVVLKMTDDEKKLTQLKLRNVEQHERMKVAQSMLFENYMQALQSSGRQPELK